MLALALPHDAAREHLRELAGRSVIDLSGAVKRDGTGVYGMVESPVPGTWYGNPGCMAMGVILGVRRCGAVLDGPLHITAIGGASYAPRDQTGTLRVANRTLSHPHVAEIERAVGAAIASFLPVQSVVGTDAVVLRAEQHDEHLTLTVGLDNLTLPATNAVRLASLLLEA